MNILIDGLPESIRVGNDDVLIVTDFRTCIRVMLAYEDNELTIDEKHVVLLNNMFYDIPSDIVEAANAAITFLDGPQTSKQDEESITGKRYYSFSKDSNFIFAAFKQTHSIDLDTADLHWWKFMALFMDIGSDTTFSNLVSLRKRVKDGKATKEERKMARELGDIFELEDIDTRTAEQKQAESLFMSLIGSGD